MKTGYLIDMDGVIYRANQLIPGARDFVRALVESGVPFVFLTNNSSPTPEDLSVRLGHLGLPWRNSGLQPLRLLGTDGTHQNDGHHRHTKVWIAGVVAGPIRRKTRVKWL